MENFCIEIKFNLPNLDEVYPRADKCSQIHHAHLSLFPKPEKKITLKVYYDENSYLPEKLFRTKDKLEDSNGIIRNTTLSNAESEHIKNIDFSQSKWKTLKTGSSYFDENGKYLIIELDSIKIVFVPHEKEEEKTNWFYSKFYLNEASRKIIEGFYSFPGFGFNSNNTWEAHNTESQYFKFGQAEIMLDFNFYSKKDSKNQTYKIFSEPRLNIRHKNLDENILVNYCNLTCAIMSLFIEEVIDFSFTQIHKKTKTIMISKIVQETQSKSNFTHIKHLGYRGTFIDFLKAINLSKIEDKITTYSKFSERYVLAKKLDGESKFMIFYNLLEQIRNLYIAPKLLQQEYNFITGKAKTKKIIRAKLRELVDIIQVYEKESFLQNVITHTNSIKFIPMQNQFQDLFNLFNLDLKNMDLNFKDLIRIRNKIFHGHPINSNSVEFKKANNKLPILVGKILLLMLGVEEIE